MTEQRATHQKPRRVLIIGGYGNFGTYIVNQLAGDPNVQLIIAGRNPEKAEALARRTEAAHPPIAAKLDITHGLADRLRDLEPDIAIHTTGPFQGQGYDVARACIAAGCHYIDLADGREFVVNFSSQLDDLARDANVLACTGASTLPALSSAIIDTHLHRFQTLESVDYAIATAQKTNRGLATTRAVLSYAGNAFTRLKQGRLQPVHGWLEPRRIPFWQLGSRRLGNCDVPDFALFPTRYPSLQDIRFQAGLELQFLQIILFWLARARRMRLLPNLQRIARPLLAISRIFDPLGSDDSGFFMTLSGRDETGAPLSIRYDIRAWQADGLNIPIIPAILMAQKLAAGELEKRGAMPCMDFIGLTEYEQEMAKLDIRFQTTIDRPG